MTFHFQTCREPSDLIPAVSFSLFVLCRPVFCSFEFPHSAVKSHGCHMPCYVFPICLFDVRGEFEAAVWTFLLFLFMYRSLSRVKMYHEELIKCFIPYYMVFICRIIYYNRVLHVLEFFLGGGRVRIAVSCRKFLSVLFCSFVLFFVFLFSGGGIEMKEK